MGIFNCFDNITIPPCVWFANSNRRNAYTSMVAGFLFFLGWWIIIDASSVYKGSILAGYHICGILGTVSLIMLNSISNAQVRGEGYEGGCMGAQGSRIWLFLGSVLGFCAVITSCWILIADFVASDTSKFTWPGVALFLQNVFIFLASLIFKFGRSEEPF